MTNTPFLNYSSNTKLLLTAEYVVLDGAKALALPLKFKQWLQVYLSDEGDASLRWSSRELGKEWFSADFSLSDFSIIESSNENIAKRLQRILQVVRRINPQFLNNISHIDVITDTDFMLMWGLGSSSTLISNIAKWADINPYHLQFEIFGGSGYDIACATAIAPIFYSISQGIPEVSNAAFSPPFNSMIGFLYSGQKMNSRDSLSQYRQHGRISLELINRISAISDELVLINDIEKFEERILEHEEIMSHILSAPTISKLAFSDYPYTIKSLGAWGGDFLMFTCRDFQQAENYFSKKGYQNIFKYSDLVL